MTPYQKVDLLRAACCVAGADGETSPEEKALIDRLAVDVGCGKASVTAMIERAQSDPDFFKEQFRILKSDPQKTVAVLIEVAMADRVITDEEVRVLKGLAKNLEISETVFQELMEKVTSMLGKRS